MFFYSERDTIPRNYYLRLISETVMTNPEAREDGKVFFELGTQQLRMK